MTEFAALAIPDRGVNTRGASPGPGRVVAARRREKPVGVCSRPATDRRLRHCTPLRASTDRCTACHSAPSAFPTRQIDFSQPVDRVRVRARSSLFFHLFLSRDACSLWLAVPRGERGGDDRFWDKRPAAEWGVTSGGGTDRGDYAAPEDR